MRINVTKQDIRLGTHEVASCPVARAIRRHKDVSEVEVDWWGATIWNFKDRSRRDVPFPPTIGSWIRDYDRGFCFSLSTRVCPCYSTCLSQNTTHPRITKGGMCVCFGPFLPVYYAARETQNTNTPFSTGSRVCFLRTYVLLESPS